MYEAVHKVKLVVTVYKESAFFFYIFYQPPGRGGLGLGHISIKHEVKTQNKFTVKKSHKIELGAFSTCTREVKIRCGIRPKCQRIDRDQPAGPGQLQPLEMIIQALKAIATYALGMPNMKGSTSNPSRLLRRRTSAADGLIEAKSATCAGMRGV